MLYNIESTFYGLSLSVHMVLLQLFLILLAIRKDSVRILPIKERKNISLHLDALS